MWDIERQFFDSITGWRVNSFRRGNEMFDTITVVTNPNNIEIELCYKRMKSIVYVEQIIDSVPYFCKNINFLDMEASLNAAIPERKMAL